MTIEDAETLDRLPAAGPWFYVLEIAREVPLSALRARASRIAAGTLLVRHFGPAEGGEMAEWLAWVRSQRLALAIDAAPATIREHAAALRGDDSRLIFTLAAALAPGGHAVGQYRALAEALRAIASPALIWIRNTAGSAISRDNSFLGKLLEASVLTGALLCDGLGDLVSIETEADPVRATRLTYNVLQGAGARTSKTEFVACPSCGRTLFDLQTHDPADPRADRPSQGREMAIMGCIVNGPGEMADADFGYVGGAPGKINLYVGKQCVQYNIPQTEADARLIALIKKHGKWAEPAAAGG